MTKRIKKLLELKNLLALIIAYSIFITIAFLSPTSGLPRFRFVLPFHLQIDKIVHISIYFVLSFLWFLYFYILHKNLNFKTISAVLLALLFYGIVIEVLQEQLVASRQSDIFDVFANVTGSFIGLFVFLKVKNRIKT